MDIFLTGGTGTIGASVLKRLIAYGHRVTALARSDAAEKVLRAAGADIVRGDLDEPADWVGDAVFCDTMVHTAATFDETMRAKERKLVLALRSATQDREIPFNLVYTGGIWLYPEAAGGPIPETTPFRPLPAFGYMAETIRSLQATRTLAVSVIHPALVCSARRGPVAEMAERAAQGRPFVTRAEPKTLWPLVDAEDLANLYLKVVEAKRYRLMVVGCGIEGVSVERLVALVAETTGKRLVMETLPPPPVVSPLADWQAGYALSQSFSHDRATRLIGWRPDNTSAEALVQKLVPVAA